MAPIFSKHADEYNDYNLSIIPCGRDNGKIALVSWKEFQQEQANLDIFDSWVSKFPDANIGLITGHLNRITVIDCDNPNISIEELQKKYGQTPLIVETPRGGKHLYYSYDGESSQNGFAENIDIKADGGYVIGPHSKNPINGQYYKIIEGNLADIGKLPKSIYPSLPKNGSAQNSHKKFTLEEEKFESKKVPEGERNNHLFYVTKNYAKKASNYQEILDYAKSHNLTHLTPPLPASDVLRTVKSIWEYKKSGRLLVSGEHCILVPVNKFEVLLKKPRALVLFMTLLKHHKNNRKEFTIVQHKVCKIIGCSQITITKEIKYLIEQGVIKQTYIGKGQGDGHKYAFC